MWTRSGIMYANVSKPMPDNAATFRTQYLQADLYSSGIPLTYNLKYFERAAKGCGSKKA